MSVTASAGGVGTPGSGAGGQHVITMVVTPKRVIEFLSLCGDAEIETAIAALLASKDAERINIFESHLTVAIADCIERR